MEDSKKKKTKVVDGEYADEALQKENEEKMLVHNCKLREQQAKESRRKFDWEWTVRQLYVRGYHYAKYNRNTSTVVFSNKSGVRLSINLVTAHLRGVRNQVTSFKPKWEVLPNVTTESAFENARYSGKVLDHIYRKAQIKRKIKEVVNDALIYSIGIWQLEVNQSGEIVVNRIDPFDFYVDPNIKGADLNDPDYGADFVCLAHQVSLETLKKNKKLKNVDQLEGDNLTAAAEYKQFLRQITRSEIGNNREINETIILKQMWLREIQEDGTFKIRNVVYVEQSDLPLLNELTDETEYPFEILQGDLTGGDLYGESWIKHIIPLNKVIDALESHIFEYNHMFARGRYVVDKNSGVRLIVNQHGQIIEKNRGSNVTSLPISPLPSTPMEQINNMKAYLEDISGVHEASQGRLPATIRSGVAIAELKQADATNQSDIVDNMEEFLSRSGKKILKLVSENWNTTKLIATTGLGGKKEYFMAIGEKGSTKKSKKFAYGEQELPLAVIGAENEVVVQIGSWLAYTKEARLEKLQEFYRLGIIDQKAMLEHAEFADVDGILERSREERILQQNAGSRSEEVAKTYGIELDEESLAMAENEMMLDNIEQFAEPNDDHEIHLMVHKKENNNNHPLLTQHIAEHERLKKWKEMMDARPLPQPPGGMDAPPPMDGMGMPPMEGMGGELPPPPGGGMGMPPVEPFMMGPKLGPGAPML